VSRQHVQALVQRLLRDRWIHQRPNPAHQRAHLLELTPEGKGRLVAMREREEASLADLELPFRPGELDRLAGGLKHVREMLEQVKEGRVQEARRG
jgi:DNA-binding MarR family transcriptional regulator